MWPQAFWKHVYEPFIRRAAGLGKAPEGRDPDTYENIHVHCDVLVIGAGVAGLAAAEAAAATGAKVIIADENPRFGGLADISGGTIEGQALPDWASAKAADAGGGRERPCAEPHHGRRPLASQLRHAVRARGRPRSGAALPPGFRAIACGRCVPDR